MSNVAFPSITGTVISGGGGVTSLNTLFGAVTISAGANITLTPVGNNIAISSTGAAPVGVPFSLAYYNSLGNLSSDPPQVFFGVGVSRPASLGNSGSLAFGRISVLGGIIATNAFGSLAFGNVAGVSGVISTNGIGSLAFGDSPLGTISSSGNGSLSFGNITTVTSIQSTGIGSLAFGSCTTPANFIQSAGEGSFAGGKPVTNAVFAGGAGSFAFGDNVQAAGDYSTVLGQGGAATAFGCTVVGVFGNAAGTVGASIPTEPAFVVGSGVLGTPANGFQVDKDGRNTVLASHVNQAIRIVAAATAINARTDYTIIYDQAGASGNFNLPAGEDGLEFRFGPKGAGAATYTLVPNGGDTLDANVQSSLHTGIFQTIQFITGTWYVIA